MEKYYFATTVDDIFDKITGTKCPLCNNVNVESNSILKRHFDARHFKYSIFYEIDGKQACILPCRRECGFFRRSSREKKRAHFHCPFCEQIYGRSASFKHHLMKTQGSCARFPDGRHYSSKNDLNLNITFVQEIEKYDELYNPSADGFNDKEEKSTAWAAVASVMNEEESACKARWKRLKASYLQYLKSLSSKPNYTPKHYLADYMKFMIPHLSVHKFDLMQPTVEIVTDVDIDKYDDMSEMVEHADAALHPNDVVSWKRKSLDSSQDEEEFVYEMENFKRLRTDLEDPDLAFFRSLLPDVNKMNNRQKSRFKRITLGVIEDILYGSEPEEPLTSLGSSFVEKM